MKTLPDEKTKLISNIEEAVEELNLIKQGKLKDIHTRDLLNEL